MILLKQEIAGASASTTVTVKEQEAVLLKASVTSKVFVVTPIGKVAPVAKPAIWLVVFPGLTQEIITKPFPVCMPPVFV